MVRPSFPIRAQIVALFLAAIALLFPVFPVAASADQVSKGPLDPAVNSRIGFSVVQLTVFNWKGAYLNRGWGFFINSRGDIITVRNLLEGGSYVEAMTLTGETLVVNNVLSEDIEGNLALISLEMSPRKGTYIQNAGKFPGPGDRVLMGGGQGCEPGAFLDGTVESVRKVPVFGLMMKVLTPFASVGSPVFDGDGNLVGIVMIRLEGGGNAIWAVPVGRVAKLLSAPKNPVSFSAWTERQDTGWVQSPTGAYLYGLASYWAGDYEGALPYLKKAALDLRYRREAYFLKGCCNDAIDNYRESAKAFSMATKLNPASADAHLKLAGALLEEGRLPESLQACWKALHLKPKDFNGFLLLSRIYNAMGDFQNALAASFGALGLKSDCAGAYLEAGRSFCKMTRYPDAIRLLEKAIELAPDLEKAYWELALTYSYQGDMDAAFRTCDALRSINQELSEQLYASLTR